MSETVKVRFLRGTCDHGHEFEMQLAKGEPFPPCPVTITGTDLGSICGAPATYELLRYEEAPRGDG